MRLISHHWVFDGLGEAALGSIALFRFRRFERISWEAVKFCGFVLSTSAITTLLVVGGATLFPSYIKTPASGPYALIFGLSALLSRHDPGAQPKLMRVLGITLSDKSLMYLVGAQLFVCQGSKSGVPAACGLLAGFLYLS